MVSRASGWIISTLLATIAILYLVGSWFGTDNIAPDSAEGAVVLGLIQVVALTLPALAIFIQVLLQHSYKESERRGKSGGVGSFSPDEYRTYVLSAGFISAFLLIIGLIAMLSILETSEGLDVGAIFIVGGIVYMSFILGVVVWQKLRHG